MNRLTIALFTALALAGCSGGGGGVAVPTAPTSAVHATASVSLSLGSATAVGATTVYPLTIKATDSSGAAISGPYLNAISLSTSDGTQTGFSSSSSGSNPSPTVSVASSTQAVFFVYNGSALTTAVTVTATSPTASPSAFIFQPGTAGGGGTAVVSSLSIVANGAVPIIGSSGAFTLTVSAYDASGQVITGTYPVPLTVSTNDSKDLSISVSGGSPSASVTVTSSSQIVVANYDGAVVPGGTVFSVAAAGAPTATTAFSPGGGSGSVASIASIVLTQVGSIPNVGTAGQFALTLNAFDVNGATISGTYLQSIVVSSNDSTDLKMATSPNGPFTASISVSNSSTVVYVAYDGAAVPATTSFSANSGTVQGNLAFNPFVTSSTAPYVNTVYVTTAGAAPQMGTPSNPVYGSQPLYVTANDQFGNLITGSYPSKISVTINNATDLDVSLDSYVVATRCEANPPTIPCVNNAAIVLNNAGQVAFANYVDAGPGPFATTGGGGALEAPNPDISVTVNGGLCATIVFPVSSAGAGPFTCQTPATLSVARLVPMSSKKK